MASTVPAPLCQSAPKHGQSGFTLIEILVTLVVIAISVAMVSLSVSSGTRPYEIKNAVRQLHAEMGLVQEEGIIQRVELGLMFTPNFDADSESYEYRWLAFDPEKRRWLPIEDVEGLAKQTLPEGLRVELELEGQPVILGDKEQKSLLAQAMSANDEALEDLDEEEKKLNFVPDIIFFSSGELISFKLSFIDLTDETSDGEYWRLVGEMIGRISLLEPSDDDIDMLNQGPSIMEKLNR